MLYRSSRSMLKYGLSGNSCLRNQNSYFKQGPQVTCWLLSLGSTAWHDDSVLWSSPWSTLLAEALPGVPGAEGLRTAQAWLWARQVSGCCCGPLNPPTASVLRVESLSGPKKFWASLAEARACDRFSLLLLWGDLKGSHAAADPDQVLPMLLLVG